MGNFATLKCLACVLTGCNNEPVLYEVSANIFELAAVREEILELVNTDLLECLGPCGAMVWPD